MAVGIDPNRDFASGYREDRDPDRYSERLYQWHRALWGREFPGVAPFDVDVTRGAWYGLLLRCADGTEFPLGSDSILPTWRGGGWATKLGAETAAEAAIGLDDFLRIASTIGGYLVWPRNRPGQTGWTINVARGMDSTIADRMDLTLECIRRHYDGSTTPNTLGRRIAYYADFFQLFRDFETYVRFFLLDDLIDDSGGVRSLVTGRTIREVSGPGVVRTVSEYREFRQRTIAFASARNERIRALNLWRPWPAVKRM